jgi:hypothetical protein
MAANISRLCNVQYFEACRTTLKKMVEQCINRAQYGIEQSSGTRRKSELRVELGTKET